MLYTIVGALLCAAVISLLVYIPAHALVQSSQYLNKVAVVYTVERLYI